MAKCPATSAGRIKTTHHVECPLTMEREATRNKTELILHRPYVHHFGQAMSSPDATPKAAAEPTNTHNVMDTSANC